MKLKNNTAKPMVALKAAPQKKSIALRACVDNKPESINKWLNDATQKVRNTRTTQSKLSRMQEIVKLRAECSKIQTTTKGKKYKKKKIYESDSWFSEMINKNDKSYYPKERKRGPKLIKK